jgi:ADP-ribose pyrophosphatase
MSSWQVLASRPLLARPPWLRVWEEDVLLPDGQRITGYLRACARDYAMVFALLPDGRVPLVQQYKHGLGTLSYDLPAGYLESPDELPLAAAQRELREETGLTALQWRMLGQLAIDTNRGDTRAHIFLAQSAILSTHQQLDATETLEVSYHSPSALCDMVLRGEVNSLASVAGIMLALQVLQTGR